MAGDLSDNLRLDELFEEMDRELSDGSAMEVDDDVASSHIHQRLKDFLAKKKAAAVPVDNKIIKLGTGTYLAIKRHVVKKT
jgi:hypothetical protein